MSQSLYMHPGPSPCITAIVHMSCPSYLCHGPHTCIPAFIHMSQPCLHPLTSHLASLHLSCIPRISHILPASSLSSASRLFHLVSPCLILATSASTHISPHVPT